MTTGLLKSPRTLDKLDAKKLKHSSDHPSVLKYKEYSNVYNRIKRQMKHRYYMNLFEMYKDDIRKTYSCVL